MASSIRPRLHECPTKCSGRDQSRQAPLHVNEFARLSASARAAIGDATHSVYRCNYCGCVYLRLSDSNNPLGHLDGDIDGPGWHSKQYPCLMEVFKTYLFFSDHDQGSPYLIDTIWHRDSWWLVGSWLQSNATGERTPERLVRLSGLAYQEVQGQSYRFLLNNSIPKAVLDGKEQGEYVVAVYPVLAQIRGPKSTH